jgi:hypothetical protein
MVDVETFLCGYCGGCGVRDEAGGNGEDMWRAVVKVAGIECT